MRQFFVEQKLQLNDIVSFDSDQSHHIRDVLRMKSGDRVRLVDRENGVYLGELSFDGKFIIEDKDGKRYEDGTMPLSKINPVYLDRILETLKNIDMFHS